MRFFLVEFTSAFDAPTNSCGTIYFTSYGSARRYCNELIRSSLQSWKEQYNISKLSDIRWVGEHVKITAVDTTPGITTKELVLRCANHSFQYDPEKPWFSDAYLIETWEPQTKWIKVGEVL
jgi:hypothetical protein